jgi:diketogulonate reductase-like aldo/keto reductase
MNTLTLNNGIQIPLIGCGTNTYGKENHAYQGAITGDTTEIESALATGYTLFDTAISYRNETVLADGIRKAGVDRSKLFITTKIPGDPAYVGTDDLVHQNVTNSLKALNTSVIDLYLIHRPWDDLTDVIRVWRALEDEVKSGRLRSIGVSNFNNDQLQYLLDHTTIKPAVNQIESHLGKWNDDQIAFGQAHGVAIEAWSPLKGVSEDANAVLSSIGSVYGKSWAQVLLRYQIERHVIVIPKSHDAQRQRDNLSVFDFKLSESDRLRIQTL